MCIIQDQYTVHDIFNASLFGYNTKVFELETFMCYDYLYEGIGSDGGLFEDPRCFEYVTTLKRYCRDVTDQECLYGFIAGIEKNNKKEISIFPNPVNDFIKTENTNNFQINKIIISDITGKNIIELNKKAFDKINITNLNKGFYFISFYSKKQLINTQKFIKI